MKSLDKFHIKEPYDAVSPTKLYEEYFVQNKKENFSFPRKIYIELTNDCNLRCIMCPRHFMDSKIGYMNPNLFKKIISQISAYPKTTIILHFRGESLLHPDFCNLLNCARREIKGRILMATNGTLLSKETVDCLINNKIDFISISVDAVDPEIYFKIRRCSDYEKTLNNIMYLLKRKKQKGLKHPTIQISMVETKFNQEHKKEFVNFWLPKVERVRIYRQHSKKGKFGNTGICAGKYDRHKPCPNLFTDMAVYWNGEVALCSHDWDRKLSIGNLKKDSIKKIWHSKKYNSVRLNHWKRKFKEASCRYCDQWLAKYMPDKVIGELYSYRKQTIKGGE